MDEELVFRFVGQDELTEVLRRISERLDTVATNAQEVVDRLLGLTFAMDIMAGNSIIARGQLERINDQLATLRNRSVVAAGATGGAAGGIGAMGAAAFIAQNPIAALVITILALTGAISGVLPVVGIFVALLIPFAVGVAAVGAAIFLAIGGIAAMGAGVILLADALFNAGLALDPLLKIETALKNMALTWAAQAYPMAIQILNWAMQFIPVVQQLGTQLLTWFGSRLNQILPVFQTVFGIMFQLIQSVAGSFTTFIDHFLSESGRFMGLLAAFGSFLGGFVNGALVNLMRLADWFAVRLPAMATIMGAGFNQIGRFIQWFAEQLGKAIDWLISAWPAAVKMSNTALAELRREWALLVQGFQWASPIFGIFPPIFNQLGRAFDFIRQHIAELRPALIGVGVVAAAMAFSFVMTIVAILAVVAAVGLLVIGIIALIGWIRSSAIPAIGAFFSAIGTWVSNVINVVGGFFDYLGTMVRVYWDFFLQHPAYVLGLLLGIFIVFVADMIARLITFSNWLVRQGTLAFFGFVTAAWNALTRLPGLIGDIFSAIGSAMVQFFWFLANQAYDGAAKIVEIIRDNWNQLPGMAGNIGMDIVRGLWNGISSLTKWIQGEAQSFVQGLISGMRAALSSGSPSMLAAYQLGVPISQGIALGYQIDMPNTQRILNTGARGLISGVAGAPTGRPININQNQNQAIALQIDKDVLAKITLNSVNRWRNISELV